MQKVVEHFLCDLHRLLSLSAWREHPSFAKGWSLFIEGAYLQFYFTSFTKQWDLKRGVGGVVLL